MLLALPTGALANPTGAQVSSGSATVSAPSASKTVVSQSTQGVVINWKSFDIGKGQTTQFVQPNAKSVAVNRIGSQNASQILGTLSANGKVVLINPNGIAFGKGSRVNVGALIATTTDGSDNDVLGGRFTKNGNQNASVRNAGRINANGTVALIAPNVSNSGVVNAKIGSVSLGGTNKFTVDFNGDGLVSFAAGDASKASVSNSGKITGANVSMPARTAEGLATGVVNTSGIITATGVNKVGGNVTLDAGDGGKISVTGAKIVASGKSGGGNVTIGGWNHGSVGIDKKSSIDASATGRGNGGNVSIISAATSVKGTIDARGGKHSGDGGKIETSGHSLDFTGVSIDTKSAHGKSGSWLLDPTDLVIDQDAADDISDALNTTNVLLQTFSDGSVTDTIGGTQVTGVDNPGDIDIEGSISWSSANQLEIDAYHSVNVYAPITVAGGGILTFSTNIDGGSGGVFLATAPISFTDLGSDPGLAINSQVYTLEDDFATLVSDVTAASAGHYAIASTLDASASSYTNSPISATAAGGVIEGLGNSITGLTVAAGGAVNVGGFVGVNNGQISNVRLVAPVVSDSVGASSLGGLVGFNDGVLVGDAVLGGSVSSSASNNNVGGLLGQDFLGPISYSSASASVTAPGATAVGGFAGSDTSGSITNSFATGNVVGGGNDVGGFVGFVNNGTETDNFAMGSVSGLGGNFFGGYAGGTAGTATITNSYATGFVSPTAGSANSGFVGIDVSGTGTFTNNYWDTDTTGILTDGAGSGTAGQTTAQLQGALPTGFGSSWATGTGLFPYLTWMSPLGTPQAVSGTIYSDHGITAAANAGFSLAIGGANPTSVAAFSASGANGYYYVLLPAGTLSNTGVAVYQTGADTGVTYTKGTGNVTGLDVYDGWQNLVIDSATYSDVLANDLPEYTATVGALPVDAGSNVQVTSSASTFTIDSASVGTLESNLAGGDVTFRTTAASGDLDVEGAIDWNSGQALTLDAYHSVNVFAPITVSSGGSGGTLNVLINHGGVGGVFLATAPVTFSDIPNSALNVNGFGYTLEGSLTDLALGVSGDTSGRYALANDDATGGSFTNNVMATLASGGIIEGLGHSLSGLSVTGNNTDNVGFVGRNDGQISNVRLVAPSVLGQTGDGMGGLVGLNNGVLIGDAVIGGSISDNTSIIAMVGGLVGQNLADGIIEFSSSSASVSGTGQFSRVGGLVGDDAGAAMNSFATGNVVAAGASAFAGGFAGVAEGNEVDDFAMGQVTSGDIGGSFAGKNQAFITSSYALGSVTAVAAGGFVGFDDSGAGSTYSVDYWDPQTTGLIDDSLNTADITGVTPENTSTFQSGTLLTGLTDGAWSTASGLFPYLTWMSPLGTPQAVSGTIYSDYGSTAAANTGFALAIRGAIPTPLAAFGASAANGYYYVLLPAGTLSNTGVAVYKTGGASGVAFTNATGTVSGLDVYDGWQHLITDAATYSDVLAAYGTTVGALSVDAGSNVEVDSTASTFTIDSGSVATVDTNLAGGDVTFRTTAGDVDIEGAIDWNSGQALTLDAYHSVNVFAPITVSSGGSGGTLNVLINHGGVGGVFLAAAPVTFNDIPNSGLNINGATYTLEDDFATLVTDVGNNSSGNYAFASDLTGGSYANSPIGGFFGVIEGLGHSISGLHVTGDGNSGVGGLVNVNLGQISNVYLLAPTVDGGSDSHMGGLVADNLGTLIGDAVIGGSVSDSSDGKHDGGLVGDNGGSIKLSYSSANVSGTGSTAEVGGLVGSITGGTISGSYTTGSISSDGSVGGLVGFNSATIDTSWSSMSVTGSNAVGGLVGYNSGTVTGSFATGDVASVAGAVTTGGFVGNNATGVVLNSYATGDVSSIAGQTGGFAGSNGNSIQYSYATGSVAGTVAVGGFVGENDSSIDTVYASGAVSGVIAEGGLVGANFGAATNSVWDSASTGLGGAVGASIGGTESGNASVDATTRYTASAYTPFTFGTTSSPTTWIIVDDNGSLNNASGNGATRPMLTSEYSTSITNAHQLQLIAMDLTADYVLDGDLDAGVTGGTGDVWSTAGFVPLGGSGTAGFGGTFNGLGAQISNLKIDSPQFFVGLFGENNTGTLSDFSLVNPTITDSSGLADEMGAVAGANNGTITGVSVVGGSVSAGWQVGGLVGLNDGQITMSSSSAAVSGVGETYGGGYVGGLVGTDIGSIDQSFATGKVTGAGDNQQVGGLVGRGQGDFLADDFAMGNVAGGSNDLVGGFMALAFQSAIATSYATGMVTSPDQPVNAFVGDDAFGNTFADNYADTETAGTTNVTGATGETTAQLQAALLTGFDVDSNWNIVAGISFPYLTWMAPTGAPQVVSGTVYSDRGTTALAGAGLGVSSSSGVLSAFGASGANGYYYALLSPNAGSANTVIYTTGTPHAVAYTDDTVANIDLYAGWTRYISDAATYSAMVSGYTAAIGLATVAPGPNLEIDAAAATFDIDTALVPPNANSRIMIVSEGSVTESTGSITTKRLILTGGDFVLDGASNVIGGLSADVGSLLLDDTSDLLITSSLGIAGVTATADVTHTGNVTLGSTGSIQLLNIVAGNEVELDAGGRLIESGVAGIDAGTFLGTSTGGAVLNGENSLGDMQSFINTGAGGVSLNNDGGLQLGNGYTLDAGDGNLILTIGGPLQIFGAIEAGNLVDLEVAGAITEFNGVSDSGTITANALTGSSTGGADFMGSNDVVEIHDFTNADAGGFNFDNGVHALLISGDIDAGRNEMDLAAGGDLSITGTLTTRGQLDISSGGRIKEASGAAITAGLLTGSATLGASYIGDNHIAKLGSFTSSVGGGLVLSDGDSLSVTGAVNVTGGGISINDALGISINSGLSASGAVSLVSGGKIAESDRGSIAAASLTGQSVGSVHLGSDNSIARLDAFDTSGHDFTLANTPSLRVTGFVNAGAGRLTLSSGFGNISLEAAIAGGKVSLTSGGQIVESGAGAITANLLTGLSTGRTILDGSANHIGRIQNYTSGGSFTLADNDALYVTGSLESLNGDVSLAVAGNSLRIGGFVSGSDVALNATSVSETEAGQIIASTLHGAATSGFYLYGPNAISNITGITNGTGNVTVLTLSPLKVSGPISAGSSSVELDALGGNLTLDGTITTTGSAHFVSAGDITELSNGHVNAGTFDIFGEKVTLTNSNSVATLGDVGVSDLAFVDTAPLTIKGIVSACGCSGLGNIAISSTGNIRILGILAGKNVSLISSGGGISESSMADIEADLLSGSALGAASLNGINFVGQLGGFTANGFSITNDETLKVTGAVNSGTGNVALTTTSGNLAIDANLTSGNKVTFAVADHLVEKSSAVITANLITGSSGGQTDLLGLNAIDKLGDFSAFGFNLVNNAGLEVVGDVVSVSPRPMTIHLLQGDLKIGGSLAAKNITLISDLGRIVETSDGAINASRLNVTANTGIQIVSLNNNITAVGTDQTNSGRDLIDKGPHGI